MSRHDRVSRRATAALVLTLAIATGVAGLGAPALAQGTSSSAAADSQSLGRGFALVSGASGAALLWSGQEVAPGGARPEFRLGAQVLGFPRETGGGLLLPLSADQLSQVRATDADLQAWSAGRRLDAAADASARPPAKRSSPGGIAASAVTQVPTDPAARGRYRTERLSYSQPAVTLSGLPVPVEMVAEVTRPVGASGALPMVLFLHGRHATCFRGGPDGEATIDWPCAPGFAPIPSHRGYRYVADVLASRGYLTVSVSANGVNGQDNQAIDLGAGARSALVRQHLKLWSAWNRTGSDPWGGAMRGRVDLSKVVLVGHSRGGEGVNRAAIDASSADPYRIVGLASYGPTAFGRQVTPDVTSATLLPTCDGDVSDLQGQAYVDASRDIAASPALRSAVIAEGANHNYFNTEWTPGLAEAPASDDWFDATDPVCGDAGSARLSAREQQRVGAAYTLALVRLAVEHDQAMLPLLDGTQAKPVAIGRAGVVVNAVGGESTLLYRPETAGHPTLSGAMTGGECLGYVTTDASGEPTALGCDPNRSPGATPHWQPSFQLVTAPAPQALQLRWSAKAATARVSLSRTGRDLHSYDSLDLRVAADPDLAPAQFDLRIRDASGGVATANTTPIVVEGWSQIAGQSRVQARTVKVRLQALRGVDLRHVVAVDLVARSSTGHVWVLDASAVRSRVPRPQMLDLPRASVTMVTVPEGNGAPTTARVSVRLEAPALTPTIVWLEQRVGADPPVGRAVSVPAGARGVIATVPFEVVGDRYYTQRFPGNPDAGAVSLGAVKGAVTGDYVGGVATTEDDPVPILSVSQSAVTGAESGSLRWTLQLSQPTREQFYVFTAKATDGQELDTDDLDQQWLEEQLGGPAPVPAIPLSQLFDGFGLAVFASFGPDAQEATVELPLRDDGVSEPQESVRFEVLDFTGSDPTLPPGGVTLTGTVPAS